MNAITEPVALMKNMPEKAFQTSNTSASFSDDELVSILEHSDAEYHDGKAMDMKKAILEARKMHGFI